LKNIAAWLKADSPDPILLLIGIYDIHATAAEPVAPENNFSNIVAVVAANAPKAHSILAQITPCGTNYPGIVKYNAHIRDVLVPYFAAQGKRVPTMDQYANIMVPGTANIDGSRFATGINHPKAMVYDRMAETWFNGIQALNLPSPAKTRRNRQFTERQFPPITGFNPRRYSASPTKMG
jgi:hypothetical protein